MAGVSMAEVFQNVWECFSKICCWDTYCSVWECCGPEWQGHMHNDVCELFSETLWTENATIWCGLGSLSRMTTKGKVCGQCTMLHWYSLCRNLQSSSTSRHYILPFPLVQISVIKLPELAAINKKTAPEGCMAFAYLKRSGLSYPTA